jgi:hypothetical protein
MIAKDVMLSEAKHLAGSPATRRKAKDFSVGW